MNIKNNCFLLLGLFSLMFFQAASADVAVIVNPKSPLSSVSQTEVVNLFLSKSKTIQGERLEPVDQAKGQATRAQFYEKVLGKDESQMRAYWSRLIFSGKGLPPVEIGNDKMMLDKVASDVNAIGYVDSSKVNASVKVLATF